LYILLRLLHPTCFEQMPLVFSLQLEWTQNQLIVQ
jgi:hypothetical protein